MQYSDSAEGKVELDGYFKLFKNQNPTWSFLSFFWSSHTFFSFTFYFPYDLGVTLGTEICISKPH